MSHLTDERIMTVIFEPAELTAAERGHLDQCATCRHAYDEIAMLADDMAVTARSQPDPAATQRYYQLFAHVQFQPRGIKARLQELVAVLSWDSRQQRAMSGVRSAAANEYRLVYTTARVEVELMVESAGARRHLEGELVPLDETTLTPALLQLSTLDRESGLIMETEISTGIDGAGRFQFPDLQPGHYRLSVTTASDQHIVIDEIVIDELDLT